MDRGKPPFCARMTQNLALALRSWFRNFSPCGAQRPLVQQARFSYPADASVQTVETRIALQNPPSPNPHQSSPKRNFPPSRPINPHAQIASQCKPCKHRYPTHPLKSTFPLPLNSTAGFSKTHPHLNPASTTVSLPISTFPTPTVTTAASNNSFFCTFPYPVSPRILTPARSKIPLNPSGHHKPRRIPRFHALGPVFHVFLSSLFTTIKQGRSHIPSPNPSGVSWHHVR